MNTNTNKVRIIAMLGCILILTGCGGQNVTNTTNIAAQTLEVNDTADIVTDDITTKDAGSSDNSLTNDIQNDGDVSTEPTLVIDEFITQYDGTQDEFEDTVITPINPEFQVYAASFKDLIDMYGEDYYVLFSAEWCPYCQISNGVISNAAVDTDTKVYYVDSRYNPRTSYQIIKDKTVNAIYNADMEALLTLYGEENFAEKTVKNDDDTQSYTYYTIFYPSLYHFYDGKVEWISCEANTDNYNVDDGLNDNEVKDLYDTYVEFFQQ